MRKPAVAAVAVLMGLATWAVVHAQHPRFFPDDPLWVDNDRFDVPEIKRLLKEKLALEDDTVAEAAFQLGGFQELDGEYQDAWANYQRASNLEPDNQLYMDAHGKNEF